MRDRMGANQPVLLQPRCPSADDPKVLNLLRLVKEIVKTEWAEIRLEPEGGSSARTYRTGVVDGDGFIATLEVGKRYRATLRVGGDAAPSAELLELFGLTLKRELECIRLREQTSILRGALDITASAILLFDDRGDIVYANPPADRLLTLQTEDQLLVRTEGEPQQPLFTLLCTLVERVTAQGTSGVSWKGMLEIADGRVMTSEVMCVHHKHGDGPTAVLAVLRPVGAGSEARVDIFSSKYGLSRREQEVVHLLIQGLTTVAMADQLGISPHTIRDHIKHLYRKTGTNSRSELLSLVAGGVQPRPSRRAARKSAAGRTTH